VIADDDLLRRHINPDQFHDDGTVSLAAFKTKDMSLDLCRLRDLETSKSARPGKGMCEFATAVPRKSGLTVEYDPIKDHPVDADNDAHCLIRGRINDGPAKRMREAAVIVFRPPARPLNDP
jgi:hypothetical protein